MVWIQGDSTGMWQEEGLCSTAGLACSRSSFSLLGFPQPCQQSFPKYPHVREDLTGTQRRECPSQSHIPGTEIPSSKSPGSWPLQLTRFFSFHLTA